MKSLKEHIEEVIASEATRVFPTGSEDRKIVYIAKRKLEEEGLLESFSYSGKTKDSPAEAKFGCSDQNRLSEILEKEEFSGQISS